MGCTEAQAQRGLHSNPGSAYILSCDLGQISFYLENTFIDNLLFTVEGPGAAVLGENNGNSQHLFP